MAKSSPLGDLTIPVTPDHREMLKIQSAIYLAKLVLWATVGYIILWMLAAIFAALWNFEETKFDKMMKVLPAIVPYWGTISGTVLGYLFGKKE